MPKKIVSIITLRLDAEEAQALEDFKKLVGKSNGSEALKYIIKDFPRWNELVKKTFNESREIEKKYDHLKEVNTKFMLAFQDMVKVVNGEDC